ncbi:bZIP transcription factor CpcA [Arthroderma uncinatum]|uniref:bZIP transcription factor CpcA n=1 Tax=Arthroderma uncinatum TaxID=74035 RepID=UPI00144A7F6F|nr:bZIP transcription factor CpcA [Arthroderma uncinatum]KAF3480234.1 bZIP transcription factor CpcA [Arthroderma uncinatum]
MTSSDLGRGVGSLDREGGGLYCRARPPFSSFFIYRNLASSLFLHLHFHTSPYTYTQETQNTRYQVQISLNKPPDVTIRAYTELDLLSDLQDGLLDAGSSSPGLSSQETSKLDSHAYTLFASSTAPSEPPNGPLNASPDLSRANAAFSTTFTIPQFDSTSFTTDNQRPSWPTQPQPSQPPASNNHQSSYNDSGNILSPDFLLFPTDPQPPQTAQPKSWPAREAYLNSTLTTHRSRAATAALPRRLVNSNNQAATYSPIAHSRVRSIAHSPRPPVPLFSNQQYPSQTRPQQRPRVMSTPNMSGDVGDLLDFTSFDMTNEEIINMEMQSYTPNLREAPKTVSPQELMLDASCPPSTSFTDLSTPSFESPGTFSHDTSPLFENLDDNLPGHEGWTSLFPGDAMHLPEEVVETPAFVATQPTPLPKQQVFASPATRAENFPKESPRLNARPVSSRHSSVSGVSKRVREKAALPPITVDPTDPVAVKRARNTEAARKSRARKVEMQESLERRIAELESELERAKAETEHWKGVAGAS